MWDHWLIAPAGALGEPHYGHALRATGRIVRAHKSARCAATRRCEIGADFGAPPLERGLACGHEVARCSCQRPSHERANGPRLRQPRGRR